MVGPDNFEKTSLKIQIAFMKLFSKQEISKITIRMICADVGIARTSFYNYYSDVYDVLESIENRLIFELKSINELFYMQNFKQCKKADFTFFYRTLEYIEDNTFWFRILLNKGKDGQFIYKWKKIIKDDFARKYHKEGILLENEKLVLEMISSGVIGAYSYWVNNIENISKEIVAKEVLYKLCADFI